ncbi:hypothetical protein CKA32_000072 [Geitlerinema sp. FC II]|nr:hypothetical protein CKA32_000072 [Geitlerinema sp. FC II]
MLVYVTKHKKMLRYLPQQSSYSERPIPTRKPKPIQVEP